ncbi:MAG: aminopeptidase P family protein [Ruminococcaceae bacterium]|nr:aminopeptidase P family protein [Oscillospiraceae bacterium]
MNHFDKISACLEAEGLDGILLIGEANRFYASGFHCPGRDGIVLVTKGGNFYFTDSRYIEAAEAQVEQAAIGMTCREKGYVAWLKEAIELTGVRRLGFEADVMTVSELHLFEEKLPVELVAADALMFGLRAGKDDEEIRRMEAAQQIAEQALEILLQELRPGMTEKEIAARLQYLMLLGGAERMSFDPIVASGPNGSMPHAVPTDRKVREGEFITMDFGCVYEGYCSDMTRTVALGQVSEEMKQVYHIVLQAQLAGIAAAKAGATGKEVDGAARRVIDEAGYGEYFGHSFGHSLGVEIHESPNATPGNEKPLPMGAVISAEPGIYLPGRFGVRIEDVLVLEEDGCRNMTRAKKELLAL